MSYLPQEAPSQSRVSKSCLKLGLAWIPVLAWVYLFTDHLHVILSHALDLPYSDEWDAIVRDPLDEKLSWRWLFATEAGGPIVFQRLFYWILLKTHRLDFVAGVLISFVFYGLVVLLMIYSIRTLSGRRMSLAAATTFSLFAFTPNAFENHAWAFQMCFHQGLLFAFVAVIALFRPSQSWPSIMIGLGASVCGLLSVHAGFGLVLGLSLVFIVAKLQRLVRAGFRQRETLQLVLGTIFLIVSCSAWYLTFRSTAESEPIGYPRLFPTDVEFWEFLSALVSAGFGHVHFSYRDYLNVFYERTSEVIAAAICGLPFVLFVLRMRTRRWTIGEWGAFALLGAILCLLAMVTMGRGGRGIQFARTSRYVEFTMLLIPFSAAAWAIVLDRWNNLKRVVLAFIFVFSMVGHFPNWVNRHWFYESWHSGQLAALTCLQNYLVSCELDDACALSYGKPELLPLAIRRAESLRLSFYTKHMATLADQSRCDGR